MNNDANAVPGGPLALMIDRGLATIRLCQPPANALGSALVVRRRIDRLDLIRVLKTRD